jgi:hypothetical protein
MKQHYHQTEVLTYDPVTHPEIQHISFQTAQT